MIRINLHPVRQMKKVLEGRRQLLVFVLGLVAEIAFVLVLYSWKTSELEEKKQQVNLLQNQLTKLKSEVGDFNQLQQQRDRLLAQRQIIKTLEKARTGPVWVMRELSNILTPSKGPTVDQETYEILLRQDPNAGFNPRWNPERLWIESFTETGGRVELLGKAKDIDDVAEFNKRLHLSKYFSNDFLERNARTKDPHLGISVVSFKIYCNINY